MLTLNLPRTGPSALQHAVETRPKATTEWLARLPFASPADAAQQLLGALYALNRHALGEDERYALLPLYRPAVARAAASLETLLAGAGVPPLAQQQQTGTLLRELRIEHSIGYKHVLQAMLSRASGRISPSRRMTELIARLIAAQRDVLIACYQTYSQPPAGLWLEMHQLYHLARTAEVADQAVDDALPASLAYRQALLLALADPPHMSHAELVHTRMFLDKFADLAVLRPSSEQLVEKGFAVVVDCDRGPSPIPIRLKVHDLWLDTEMLRRQLHEATVRLQAGDSPRRIGLPPSMDKSLSRTLGKHLLKLWHTGSQRAFNRYAAAGSTLQLVAGVSAIHRLLEQVPQAPEPSADADADANDKLDVHDLKPLLAASAAVHTSHWAVINDSAAGLALSGTPDAPLNLKVGDALALRTEAAADWSLGVIRWIRMHNSRAVELGVQRLSPHLQPVWVRPLRGQRKASPEPALLIPGVPALQQPDRLLLPRNIYQPGMDAVVWHAPRQYTLTFGRRHEHTPNFDLIDFTIFASEHPHD
jgi:hypothetical protein